ncbi:hypothetical protein OFO03_01085 [Campylobacter sp. JMF_02 ED1]|uniref:hypothetical protein n=1 Tax=unclassified Campylobacter TaxID=2593542 RepID=UPI0022E9F216|nr:MULTISPECIES: hypothetical protein [unclassified Campylobacter]MDA3048080.1 hypothetical protein [Campylobacter sp. JMF_08 NE1]MDA3048786.1 hypothetical protein [Campylobacter sp. JMF_15 NE4]MDA3050502.1 hypothetical protein [Campylobacter sp. JMF_02 ED1]
MIVSIFGGQGCPPYDTSGKNGFEALSEFDTNNDGIIDSNDEKFANLNLLVA